MRVWVCACVCVCVYVCVCACVCMCVYVSDQVWIRFQCIPKCLFGFCYIPPSDSEYYSHDSFASIQEKIKTNEDEDICIIGDMNARFGGAVQELLNHVRVPTGERFSYPVIRDDIRLPNANAFILSNMCKESNILLLNNLKTSNMHFSSDKTFRQGNEWVSELDTCVLNPALVGRVTNFLVLLDVSMPSDRSPITVTMTVPNMDLENLLVRAQHLGDHAVLYTNIATNKNVRIPVSWSSIDERVFLSNLCSVELPLQIDHVEETVATMCNKLHDCAIRSRRNTTQEVKNPVLEMGKTS